VKQTENTRAEKEIKQGKNERQRKKMGGGNKRATKENKMGKGSK
jgi:hypothetical protein